MPIYDIADWYAMQEQIKAGGKAVSGMTVAEAQAALKTQAITTRGGSNLHVYNPGASAPVQHNIQFPGTETPVDAYWEYVNQGGNVNASGAATSGSGTVSNSNLTLTKTAGGTTGVAGLLSMNLPTAAAAIAPIAGVALGAGLYYASPELWNKISRALLPFCYEDTELLPVVVDEDGVTYFSKEAIDAVKAELAGISYDTASSPSTSTDYAKWISPYPFQYAITDTWSITSFEGVVGIYKSTSPIKIVGQLGRAIDASGYFVVGGFIFASESPATITAYDSTGKILGNNDLTGTPQHGYTGNMYAGSALSGTDYAVSMTIPVLSITLASDTPTYIWADIADMMLHGTQEKVFPTGTSAWTGVQYPLNPEGTEVVTKIENGEVIQTEPYFPITIPVGDPGVSVPSTTPDITVNPNPEPAINPWISPNPAPGTYPADVPQSNPAELPGNVPDYTPNLDPNADPSQEPAPEPSPEPEPAPSENSTGTSPIPIIPEFPTLPSSASGLLHVYNPTQGQIDAFGSWLWTTFSGDIIDTVSKLFNNPMDAVIGLHELYATPAVSGSSTIRAGYLDSGVSSNLVGSRYTSINCGSVVVPEYYQNYLDYSPYTKCFVYLPFVGIVPVSADDIIGNAVNIKYNIDSYNGCCIAIITVARGGYSSTVYQFEGNCGVEVPITSGYQSTLMGGLLGIAGTAISGSPHVGLAAASLGRANLGKNEVSHSGSFGSSYGAMGAKIPYIIVKRPTQKSVVNYNDEYGFPAHKRVRIGDCSGYLRAREVHVVSPTATDEEKERIEEMLKEGVFVK